ncbi:hypothetical protein RUM44_008352 [Polyplax serrata]|uniref:INO80 complex subunit B-like conserved region domain-containing protein n=1 Tax=Polyplax serrata TaxID=468196 RepID=A0ABR1BCI0_POLSC
MIYGKDSTTDDDEEIDVSSDSKTVSKRHRKHKHKKHKRKKLDVDEEKETPPPSRRKHEVTQSPVQKYVDKIGQGLGLVPSNSSTPTSTKNGSQKKKRSQRKDSETSSEEERWLDAIQSGKLDEVDEELKKIKPKDPKLMTARQRAMLERKTDKEPEEQLMALPSGYKEVVMTAEAIQRKAIKSQKRKQMADEKREKDKKKTMERLLKKQDSKTIKSGAKKVTKKTTPQIVYVNANGEKKIIVPEGYQFPLSYTKAKEPPMRMKCAMDGCENDKRYSCSKTGFPLCSLNCYKANLLRIQNML